MRTQKQSFAFGDIVRVLLIGTLIVAFVTDAEGKIRRRRRPTVNRSVSSGHAGLPGVSSRSSQPTSLSRMENALGLPPSPNDKPTLPPGVTMDSGDQGPPPRNSLLPGVSVPGVDDHNDDGDVANQVQARPLPGVSGGAEQGDAEPTGGTVEHDLQAWERVAEQLNQLRDKLEADKVTTEEPLSEVAKSNVRIESSRLAELEAEQLNSLESGLYARAYCEGVMEHLRSFNHSAMTGDEHPSKEAVEPEKEQKAWTPEEWLDELNRVASSTKKNLNDPCTTEIQTVIQRIVTAAGSSPASGKQSDEHPAILSTDFQNASDVSRLVVEVVTRVQANDLIGKPFLVATEQQLENLGFSLEDRTQLWLWGARSSALLGKKSDAGEFLKLRLAADQVADEFTSIKTQFLNGHMRSGAVQTMQIETKSLNLGMNHAAYHSMAAESGMAIIEPSRQRLRTAAFNELPSLSLRFQECHESLERQLLEKLDQLAVNVAKAEPESGPDM